MVIPLSNIGPGDSAQIVSLGNEEAMAGRLRDLGFVPGAIVCCVLQKAKKNIAAYLVRGAVIALREEDSRLVLVKDQANETEHASVMVSDSDFCSFADTPTLREVSL